MVITGERKQGKTIPRIIMRSNRISYFLVIAKYDLGDYKKETHLKKTYKYIIIDTSPVGIVADAYPLMSIADTVIYLARSKKTDKKFFKTVIRQLKMDGIYHIGIVLNDLDTSKSGYGYHYGYHRYGYGYYGRKKAGKDYTKDYYEE